MGIIKVHQEMMINLLETMTWKNRKNRSVGITVEVTDPHI